MHYFTFLRLNLLGKKGKVSESKSKLNYEFHSTYPNRRERERDAGKSEKRGQRRKRTKSFKSIEIPVLRCRFFSLLYLLSAARHGKKSKLNRPITNQNTSATRIYFSRSIIVVIFISFPIFRFFLRFVMSSDGCYRVDSKCFSKVALLPEKSFFLSLALVYSSYTRSHTIGHYGCWCWQEPRAKRQRVCYAKYVL